MRFTRRAQQVLILAYEEAQHLQHTYIGTEHLLLALLQDDGTGGNLLRLYGLKLISVREIAQQIYDAENYKVTSAPELALDLKIVISQAVLDSRALRSAEITSEQLLQTMLSQPTCHATAILKQLNIRQDSLRQEYQIARGGGPPALRRHRFGPMLPPILVPTGEMPTNLSPNAKHALALAKDEARHLGHPVISSAHLLLGLMDTVGQAQRVLNYLGLDSAHLREALERFYSTTRIGTRNILALSPDLEEVLMLAASEGVPGENAIGTGHLLLGITLQPSNAALEILKEFNTSACRIQGLVIRKSVAE